MRFFTSLLLLLFSIFVHAQTSQNSWFVNGAVHLDKSTYGNSSSNKRTLIDADLKIGYCFFNNFIVGAYFPFEHSTFSTRPKESKYGYGTFSRLHFNVGHSSLYFQGSMDYLLNIRTEESTRTRLNAGFGIHHFMTKNMAVNIGIDINFIKKEKFVGYSESEPTEGEFIFGLEYFFHQKNNSLEQKKSLLPIKDRYLKNGNNFIGLTGRIKPYYESGLAISWDKFYTDRFLLFQQFNFYTNDQLDNDLYRGNIEYKIGAQLFIPISDHFYYAPKISASSWMVLFPSRFDRTDPGMAIELKVVGLHCFLGNSILETGIAFDQLFYFSFGGNNFNSSNLYLGWEKFLTDHFSIKALLNVSVSEAPFIIDDNADKWQTNIYHLSWGMNYLISK